MEATLCLALCLDLKVETKRCFSTLAVNGVHHTLIPVNSIIFYSILFYSLTTDYYPFHPPITATSSKYEYLE